MERWGEAPGSPPQGLCLNRQICSALDDPQLPGTGCLRVSPAFTWWLLVLASCGGGGGGLSGSEGRPARPFEKKGATE